MAGGKVSPRQKMINMMYLVLTAMLALNVSKDIIKVLTKLDQGMNETVATVFKGTEVIYSAIANAMKDNPRAVPINDRALKVKSMADDINKEIVAIKTYLIEETGGYNTDGSGTLKGGDNRDVGEVYLVVDKSVGGQGKAKELKERLITFREAMVKEADGDKTLIATIKETFNFQDVVEEGTQLSWEKATFSELPLAGVIPFLTDLQSRVRRTESKVVDHLYSQIDANTLKFDNVKAVVMPTNGTYIQQGDYYEADVFLAAYDNSRNPQFSGISVKEVKEGVGKVSIQGTGNGEVKKMVTISLPGGDKTYQAEIKYTVSPPSSVISPSKMNVFYRNVENPLEVSVPGVAPSSLRVSGPGISGKNGNYIADVTKVEGKTMMVNVSVEENGKLRKVGSKEFRIKGLPMASGMVFRKSSGVMSTSSLAKAPIEAEYIDFPFELPLKVVSAEVKIEGQPPIQVKGGTFDNNTRELIQRLKPGSSVTIRKIVATTPNGARVSNVGNISIDVQ